MSTTSKASIIIPNYNYERYVGRAIESALYQTCSAEVIVIDDGSIDNSRMVIESFGGSVKPLFKQNGGMASTYNAGFAISTGDVVIFLDSDDVLEPKAVEEVMAEFHTGIAKVHWPLAEIDADGHNSGSLVPPGPLPSGDFRSRLISDGPDVYLSPPTSGNAWSRAFLDQVTPLPEDKFRQHADIYLATLAPLFGRIHAIDKPLGYYRVHGSNDYAGKPVDEKNRRNLAIYEHRCTALADHLERLGISFSHEDWLKAGTSYAWMAELDLALRQIKEVVPDGSSFILVDGDEWGGGRTTEIVTGRRAIPFMEQDQQYFGPPCDDEEAIREVIRQKEIGASHIVFGWPAFWWLEHYAGLASYLRSNYPIRYADDKLIIFDLLG